MERRDDHPVRTTFIEAVAARCGVTTEVARKFIAPITTDVIDVWWPINQVAEQFANGDLVATYYPPKGTRVVFVDTPDE